MMGLIAVSDGVNLRGGFTPRAGTFLPQFQSLVDFLRALTRRYFVPLSRQNSGRTPFRRTGKSPSIPFGKCSTSESCVSSWALSDIRIYKTASKLIISIYRKIDKIKILEFDVSAMRLSHSLSYLGRNSTSAEHQKRRESTIRSLPQKFQS